MRYFTLVGATIVCAAMTANAFAISPGVPSATSPVQFIQDKPKKEETVKQKVKRIWREWTGYKFDVACPIFPIPITRSTCTETGKNREEARAKCQSRNAFCAVGDSRS